MSEHPPKQARAGQARGTQKHTRDDHDPAVADLEGRVIKVDAAGDDARITIARGSSAGIAVGMDGYIKALGRGFKIDAVTDRTCSALVDARVDEVQANQVVVLAPTQRPRRPEVKPASWVNPTATGHVGSVFFHTKDAHLDAHDRALFEELAAVAAPQAKQNLGLPGKQLGLDGNVTGYADPRPSSEPDNQTLSGQRAASVADALQRSLVDATRLDAGEFRIARVGAGVAPDAGADMQIAGEGDAGAPFRRADIYLDLALPKAPPSAEPIGAPAVAVGSIEPDGWDRWRPQIEAGNTEVITDVANHILGNLVVGFDSQISADLLYTSGGATEEPPWWVGRDAAIFPSRTPSSLGRSAERNAEQTRRSALIHDTLLLIRDYQALLEYRAVNYTPAVERAKRERDKARIDEARRPLRYLQFMYLETIALARRVVDDAR